MLPKTHFILGLIFAGILFFLFKITFFDSFLILFSSVFIDVDHYVLYGIRKKDWNLNHSYKWHKDLDSLPKESLKPYMHLLHSVEFLVFIGILSFYFNLFLFIFLGLIFHSTLDLISMTYDNALQFREFSFIRYLLRDKENYF